jgi:hypothetical protein
VRASSIARSAGETASGPLLSGPRPGRGLLSALQPARGLLAGPVLARPGAGPVPAVTGP